MANNKSGDIFGYERWRSLARCTIHIPAVAISVALLVLNFSTKYFDDPDTSHQNLRFNSLQFAAKLHEILVAASLSTAAISYIQYELVHSNGRGLSLGGVLAGFQLTDLSAVCSPGLWSKSLNKGFRVRRLLFALIVITLMIMAAIVGPSSAILMLPAIGWWPVPYEISNPGPIYPKIVKLERFFASTKEEMLWPTNITIHQFMPPACTYVNASTPGYCPAGGFSNILAQATERTTNYSIPTGASGVGGMEIYNRLLERWGRIISTPSSSVSNMLQTGAAYYRNSAQKGQSTYYKLSLPNGTSFFGPQTIPVCSSSQKFIDDNSDPMSATIKRQINFPIIGNSQGWSLNSDVFIPFWNQSELRTALWIDPPFLGNNTPSIAAAFIYVTDKPGDHRTWIRSCSVYTSWVPHETYLKPSTGSSIYSSSLSALGDVDTVDSKHANGTNIRISAEWANLALPPTDTIIQLVPKVDDNIQQWSPQEVRGSGFGRAISLLVTDAISRIGNDVVLAGLPAAGNDTFYLHNLNGHLGTTKNNPDFNIDNATALTLTILRNGYSYSMDGVTRRIAAAILLVHILIALVHTTILVGFGRESTRLKSLSELFLLTANSSPAEPPVKNTKKSFGYTIKVCRNSDSQLGIIIEDHQTSNVKLLPLKEREPGNTLRRIFRRDPIENSSYSRIKR